MAGVAATESPRGADRLALGATIALATLGLAATLVLIFVVHPYLEPSAAMGPDLRAGDYFFVTKRPFEPKLRRGDVVVFWSEGAQTYFDRRVIGLPGERVQLRNDQVYVNGVALQLQPRGLVSSEGMDLLVQHERTPEGRGYWVETQHGGSRTAADTQVYVVPPGCYFLLGDNRDNVLDSRFAPSVANRGCPWPPRTGLLFDEPGQGFVADHDVAGVMAWNVTATLDGRASPDMRPAPFPQ